MKIASSLSDFRIAWQHLNGVQHLPWYVWCKIAEVHTVAWKMVQCDYIFIAGVAVLSRENWVNQRPQNEHSLELLPWTSQPRFETGAISSALPEAPDLQWSERLQGDRWPFDQCKSILASSSDREEILISWTLVRQIILLKFFIWLFDVSHPTRKISCLHVL